MPGRGLRICQDVFVRIPSLSARLPVCVACEVGAGGAFLLLLCPGQAGGPSLCCELENVNRCCILYFVELRVYMPDGVVVAVLLRIGYVPVAVGHVCTTRGFTRQCWPQ